MPKQLFIPVCSILCMCCYAHAQQAPSDSAASSGVAAAVQVFHQATGHQSQLYNGRVHIAYPPNMLGSAYYLSKDAQTGAVEYDHILFRNVPLWYDEVRDKVVVLHFNGVSAFELFSERIGRFWLGSHPFLRIVQEAGDTVHTPATGFYEELCTGKLTLLAKRKKLMVDFIDNMEVKKRIDLKESFFARIDGIYYPVNSQRALLSVMKDKKRDVQQYMKKGGWKFRKGPETYLVKATEYYNQSIR